MDVLANTDFPDWRTKNVIQSAGKGSLLMIPREGGTMVRLKQSSDEYSAVDSSRTLFKWLTIVMLAVNLWHGGKLLYRVYPFLGKTVETDKGAPSELPKGYGSGGGGRFIPGQAAPGGAKQSGEDGEGGGGGLKNRMKDAGGE